jgi:hypothetical protein
VVSMSLSKWSCLPDSTLAEKDARLANEPGMMGKAAIHSDLRYSTSSAFSPSVSSVLR